MKKMIFLSAVVLMALVVGCIVEEQEDKNYDTIFEDFETAEEEGPITTWEQAFDLAKAKYGSSEIWDCNETNMRKEVIAEGPLPQHESGYYGYHGTTLLNNKSEIISFLVFFECLSIDGWDDEGRPTGGKVLLSFRFDPNNGWVNTMTCGNSFYDNCPKNESGDYIYMRHRNWRTNPNYEKYLAIQ